MIHEVIIARRPRPAAINSAWEWLVEKVGNRMVPKNLVGHIRVITPGGKVAVFGHVDQKPGAVLHVHSWKVLWRAMAQGACGFSESYIRGEVDTPDPVALVQFFARNLVVFRKAGGRIFRKRVTGGWLHKLNRNTKRGSKKNIAAHYDLGNAFFAEWLDPTMTYSSGIFRDQDENLEQAQQRKYDTIIEAMNLKSGASVLEIGCGWGGLAERLVTTTDASVRGITLSQRQLEFAQSRMARIGASDRATFDYTDYRDCEGSFDAICSIEMIEAVGEEYWDSYFKVLGQRLKPGGSAAIQAITIKPEDFDYYRRGADFIQRYIFPGGMLPTVEIMQQKAEKYGFTFETVEEFADSYADTLNLWAKSFAEKWPRIAPLGFDERFRRTWNWYLCYCEGGFREKEIEVGIYRLVKKA
ncbi:MAG: cyclopropane-fatty-acyl-phospholipid synthase family protein [Pseudomonadota bacterium]